MTDKQIIIDGVDVSGCKYFDCCNKECKAEYYTRYGYEIAKCDSCKDNPNCYFKQLKREERECQQAMDNYVKLDLQRVKEYNELVDLYKTKEQECEELKKELQAQRDFTAHEQKLIYCVAYDESCKTGNDCKQKKCIFKDNIKLKQTIAEIKEIAEPYKITIKKICGNCKKYDDCNACCYKNINCYKYTSPKTNACEAFTYLDEFVPNILANKILQKIRKCEDENKYNTKDIRHINENNQEYIAENNRMTK